MYCVEEERESKRMPKARACKSGEGSHVCVAQIAVCPAAVDVMQNCDIATLRDCMRASMAKEEGRVSVSSRNIA